jgi:hypothetical protein
MLQSLPELVIAFRDEQQLNMFKGWLLDGGGEYDFMQFMQDNYIETNGFLPEAKHKLIQQEIEDES